MTGPAVRPHWSDVDRWSGFFLLIVPTVGLAVTARQLYHRMQRAIETDAVLFDLVTIGLGPVVDGSFEQNDAVATALIAGATAQGHLFAPLAVFGCLVVGPDDARVESGVEALASQPLSRALHVLFSGHVLAAERRRDLDASVDDPMDEDPPEVLAAIAAIAAFARHMMREYEREPLIASSEDQFLAVYRGLADEPALPTSPPPVEHVPPTAPSTDIGRRPGPAPAPARRGPVSAYRSLDPAPASPQRRAELDTEPATGWRRPAPVDRLPARLMSDAAIDERYEPIPVNPPTLWQRAKDHLGVGLRELTEAESMDQLASDTDAVGLVYLVFVPDDKPQSRAVQNRRKEVAVKLDSALSDVGEEPATGRAMHVSVDVLGAVGPLTRYATLRPAGLLRDKDIPRIPVDFFDVYEMVHALVRELRRTVTSMLMRGVSVLNTHVIFLATTGPLANRESVARFDELLRHARITWLHFGPATEMISEAFGRRTRYHAVLLADQPDVVNLVMHYSEDLYRVTLPDD